MQVKYSSDSFTRALILSAASRLKNREDFSIIRAGSNGEASPEAKESYFKFGSALFTVMGVSFLFMGVIAMILTLIIHGLLGFGFFFYYAPGAMLTATGYALGMWEKKLAQKEIVAKFTGGYLWLAWSVGIVVALFIATFPAMNGLGLS